MARYRLSIIDEKLREHRLHIDRADLPYSGFGLPGSILDICRNYEIQIDCACGGVCACTLCHIEVLKGNSHCSLVENDEAELLLELEGRLPGSRLACQCVPSGRADTLIRIVTFSETLC